MKDAHAKAQIKLNMQGIKRKAHLITSKVKDYRQHSITMRKKEEHLKRIRNTTVTIRNPKKRNLNSREAINVILNYY